jgi:Family of unknown function (DUF6220)
MRRVFFGLAVLLLAAVVLQFFFAGYGSFAKPRTDHTYDIHRIIGMMVIPVISILMTIFAALSKGGGRLIGMSLLPLGLVVLQIVIAAIARAVAGDTGTTNTASLVIFGLHALNGIAIGGVAGSLLSAGRKLMGGEQVETGAAAPATS